MKALTIKDNEQAAKDKACATAMQSSNKAKAQIAFNQIYKRWKSPIFYMALRYVKMNRETGEDLTQEIFVKVFEKIKNYDFSVAFSTWMYNVAKNHLIDYKRRQKVEVLSIENLNSEFGGDEEVKDISFQIEDKSADTFSGVVKGERALAVIEALNKGVKSEDAKQVIALIFLDEMTYEEVSAQVKMPLGTVKAIMFRAKSEMKEYLSVKSRDFEYGRIRKTKFKFVAETEEA